MVHQPVLAAKSVMKQNTSTRVTTSYINHLATITINNQPLGQDLVELIHATSYCLQLHDLPY